MTNGPWLRGVIARGAFVGFGALSLLHAGAPAPSQDSKPAQDSRQGPRTQLFDKSEAPLPADTYCKIDGFPVLRTEYGDWLQKYKGDLYIKDYVLGKLVRDAAKAAGVEAKPEEIEQKIDRKIEERTLSAYRGRRELFVQYELTAFGKTLEQYRREQSWDTETDILIQKTMKARRLATDADVEKEFRRLYGTSGRSLRLRAILIEIDSPSITSHKPVEEIQRQAQAKLEEARAKAIKVVKNIQSGATDFASQALAYSDDARSKTQGGDIGDYIASPPEFGEEFDQLIQKARVGQIIGPVRIQSGFVIAEITRETLHDLRKERDAIRKDLVGRDATFDEVQAYLVGLLLAAKLVR